MIVEEEKGEAAVMTACDLGGKGSRKYSGGGGGPAKGWVYCDGQSGRAGLWGGFGRLGCLEALPLGP